jgi:hypothetical protein
MNYGWSGRAFLSLAQTSANGFSVARPPESGGWFDVRIFIFHLDLNSRSLPWLNFNRLPRGLLPRSGNC